MVRVVDYLYESETVFFFIVFIKKTATFMTHRPTDSVFPTTPQGYVVDTIETRISKSFSYRSGAF